MFDFIDTKTAFTLVHLLGVALGAGGAYMSDIMFFTSIKDVVLTKTEIKFMRIGSTMVWIGLALLILSGIGLFSTNVAGYLASSKFLAKMSIVLILTINGIVFHASHIPRIHRHAGHHLPSSDEFMRARPLLLTSGAISITSWTFALMLGGLKSVPYPYHIIMLFYMIVVLFACTGAMLLSEKILPTHKKKK